MIMAEIVGIYPIPLDIAVFLLLTNRKGAVKGATRHKFIIFMLALYLAFL